MKKVGADRSAQLAIVAELAPDKTILQDALAKNFDAPAAPPGGEVSARHLPGERAACVLRGTNAGIDLPV